MGTDLKFTICQNRVLVYDPKVHLNLHLLFLASCYDTKPSCAGGWSDIFAESYNGICAFCMNVYDELALH